MKTGFRIDSGRIAIVSPHEIFYIEAQDDDTSVRLARRQPLASSLSLAEWSERLAGQGFVRIHRSYLVNLDRVRELRLRPGDPNDWELKLEPPVNAILPISRSAYLALKKRLGF